jgi:hypothetical protein
MRAPWALLGVIVAAALPIGAHAEGALGGSAGWARLNGSDFADDGASTGWKAVIGTYNQIWGVEAQYIDFGHPGDFGSRIHAYTSGLTAGWHFGGFYPYAKLGAAFEDVKHKSVADETDDYHRTNVYWGAGFRFPLARQFGLRFEYERYQLRGEREDLASAGAELRF